MTVSVPVIEWFDCIRLDRYGLRVLACVLEILGVYRKK